ncbi:MAG: SAM-dependent methyltransferase [Muribaculaceae bacterium]|nr:SAM-dependent methyltransferase [Muribaculaceae bacterium]
MKTNPELAADKIIAYASREGKDIPVCFQDWLQWLIEVFDIRNLLENGADYMKILSPENLRKDVYQECLTLWVKCALEHQQQHKCVDFFGEVYEWCFQSKSKAARMGQYFTPYPIGSLMARCMGKQVECNGAIYCSEPSCGSGRNLLALWADADWNKRYVWYAEDLDPVSVKMCALNMMINGMFGYVICHNTLIPDDFIFGYAINEVRDPIPCDYFSIRQITKEEFDRMNPWQPSKPTTKVQPKQQSLFDYES